MQSGKSSNAIVVSALSVRTGFGKLLRRVEDEHRSLVIEKRGTPKAVLLSIRDYVRLAAPEPDVLRAIGEESKRKGTDKLTSRQIDQAIAAVRAKKPKRG
jgi:prevent-host-death family protein